MAFFNIVRLDQPSPKKPARSGLLLEDRWDDWGKFRTQFHLIIFDEQGNKISVGDIKIGQNGLQPGPSVELGVRAPSLPDAFDHLPPGYFSLGQTESYYEALNQNPSVREHV